MTRPIESDDRAIHHLATGALRGSPTRAWNLIEIAWPRLTRFVILRLRHDRSPENMRKDCGQNIFWRVWKYRKSYAGTTEGEFWAWLRRICDNEHRRLLQSEGRKPLVYTDLAPEGSGPRDDPAGGPLRERPDADRSDPTVESVMNREAASALRACLAKLDPRVRRVVEWIYFRDELSERAVAAVLEVSPSYVHKLKERGLEQLRRCLSGRAGGPADPGRAVGEES